METKVEKSKLKVLVPLGKRIVYSKDKDKEKCGSIILPDIAKTYVLTGRVVGISEELKNDINFNKLELYDQVLVDPRTAVPATLEPDNKLFVIDIEFVLGVYKDADEIS